MCICGHGVERHETKTIDRTGQAWGVTIVRPTVCLDCRPMIADHRFQPES